MFGYGQTVTVHRITRDQFDDPISGTSVDVTGCAIVRHSTSEDRDRGHQVTETATVAMPADTPVGADDHLVFPDGSRWHVDGRPRVPASPFSGWEPALSVPVRRVTG